MLEAPCRLPKSLAFLVVSSSGDAIFSGDPLFLVKLSRPLRTRIHERPEEALGSRAREGDGRW